MTERGAYGERLGRRFRLKRAPSFVTRVMHASEIAMTHIRCDNENNGLTGPIPREDALLVTVQLRDCPFHELWIDGRATLTGPLAAGTTCVYDLRTSPIVNSISPFENVHFYLPFQVLAAVAEEEGLGPVGAMAHQPGLGMDDPVLGGLAMALQPAFRDADHATQAYVDHVATAVVGHVAGLVGRGRRTAGRRRSLSAEQERRAKELLAADLLAPVSMAALARACGLSVTALRRGFFLATGVLPHVWRERYRIERAIALVQQNRTAPDIAAACGFASETHLARALAARSGRRPG